MTLPCGSLWLRYSAGMTGLDAKAPFPPPVGRVVSWIYLGLLAVFTSCTPREAQPDAFIHWMNVGKNFYDQGQGKPAIEAFSKAVALQPVHAEARLNLANAFLLDDQAIPAFEAAREVLRLNPDSAAARYLAGCALLRQGQFIEAIQFLQECRDMDVKINTVSFQLARAHQGAGHWTEAVELLQSVVEWEPKHPQAHYLLSQLLFRLKRNDEAQQSVQKHMAITAETQGRPVSVAESERCVYTEVHAPFVLEQPATPGIRVVFSDVTATAFGTNVNYQGPVGILDINQRGQNDLLVLEGTDGFRLLWNTNGVFVPQGPRLPALAGARFTRCLVGDLNNDRYEDAVLLSDVGLQIIRFATNGAMTDATAFAGMKRSAGIEGALVDLDLTGKLDLLLLSPTNREPRVLRNLGPMYFKDVTSTSGIPATLTASRQIVVDDWNGDDLMDVVIVRDEAPPQVLIKQRGGQLSPSNAPAIWPAARLVAVGDINNDYMNDIVMVTTNRLAVFLTGVPAPIHVDLGQQPVTALRLMDYDNDGWLDLVVGGEGIRCWRNLGQGGFREATRDLALQNMTPGKVVAIQTADFDRDGDSDLLLTTDGGLRLLRNDGGHAHHQLKLRLHGTRSNASGLGVRIEVKAATWRALRTVSDLPVEIGLGRYQKPEVVKPRWTDITLPVTFELQADPKTVWTVMEIEQPTGSCPYLYAWNGSRFRFVTDILGASPLGLPISEQRYVEADPEEYVSLGRESEFVPKDGHYVLQVTEELREVLYLDDAKLVVVDHPAGNRVCSTSKMLPGRPFLPHELIALCHPRPLRHAENHLGADVTDALRTLDSRLVSPTHLRVPQLRGLAEPSSVTVDFGPLPVERPLVLVLNGWLRFGGGMANIAASHDPNLPFPFPQLAVEVMQPDAAGNASSSRWRPVDVTVGVPCGKTKTITVDLSGKLPPGSRRLKLTTAYELHWDQIELWERDSAAPIRITRLAPSKTDLHWRGFCEFEDLPWFYPLTPNYEKVESNPHWRITPSGWCTRYGPVDELIAAKDNALVLLNGGDELTLVFAEDRIPPKPAGYDREFFFYSVGWDKDSDFHVATGTTVGPLPFHGMDDQRYGSEERPAMANDDWMNKYNTRWVGPQTLTRARR